MHPAVVAVIIVGGALMLWSGYEATCQFRDREYEAFSQRRYKCHQFSEKKDSCDESSDDDGGNDDDKDERNMYMKTGTRSDIRRRPKRTSSLGGNQLSMMEQDIIERRQRLEREQEYLNQMELALEQRRTRLNADGNRTMGLELFPHHADEKPHTSTDDTTDRPHSQNTEPLASSSSSDTTVLPVSLGNSHLSFPDVGHDGPVDTIEQGRGSVDVAENPFELPDVQWQADSFTAWTSEGSDASWASIERPRSNASERSFNSIQTPSSPSRLSDSSFSNVSDVSDAEDMWHSTHHPQ